jgi:hypothetical protein
MLIPRGLGVDRNRVVQPSLTKKGIASLLIAPFTAGTCGRM